MAQGGLTIVPRKIFFYPHGPVYLLGHKVGVNGAEKIDREEFEIQRGRPFEGHELSDTHPRGYDLYYLDEG